MPDELTAAISFAKAGSAQPIGLIPVVRTKWLTVSLGTWPEYHAALSEPC